MDKTDFKFKNIADNNFNKTIMEKMYRNSFVGDAYILDVMIPNKKESWIRKLINKLKNKQK